MFLWEEGASASPLGAQPSPVSSTGAAQTALEELGALYVSMPSYAGAGPASGPGQNPSGLSA